ncbi:hypothetical protein BC829DRAFT_393484 [Chytridium lagenaria]|nr:hypothetical protein BC829DRAFT_393484 [Chytridium lagenaria]
MTSLGNMYSSAADLEARLNQRRSQIHDLQAKTHHETTLTASTASLQNALTSLHSTAWENESPPTPEALARLTGETVLPYSERVAAERATLIGRASATFIYHLNDKAASKRFSPYLWAAYASGLAVVAGVYGVVKLRKWQEEERKRGVTVDDLIKEVKNL